MHFDWHKPDTNLVIMDSIAFNANFMGECFPFSFELFLNKDRIAFIMRMFAR